MSDELIQAEVEFGRFVDYVFDHEEPPAPNSLLVELDLGPQSTEEDLHAFLYELFVRGFKIKFKDVPLTQLNEYHFNTVRDYIRGISYECILMGYEVNDAQEITSIRMSFAPYKA